MRAQKRWVLIAETSKVVGHFRGSTQLCMKVHNDRELSSGNQP